MIKQKVKLSDLKYHQYFWLNNISQQLRFIGQSITNPQFSIAEIVGTNTRISIKTIGTAAWLEVPSLTS